METATETVMDMVLTEMIMEPIPVRAEPIREPLIRRRFPEQGTPGGQSLPEEETVRTQEAEENLIPAVWIRELSITRPEKEPEACNTGGIRIAAWYITEISK